MDFGPFRVLTYVFSEKQKYVQYLLNIKDELYFHFVHLTVLFVSHQSTRLNHNLFEMIWQARRIITINFFIIFDYIYFLERSIENFELISFIKLDLIILIFLQIFKMHKDKEDACKLQIKSFISQVYQEQSLQTNERLKQELLRQEIFNEYSQDERTLNLFCDYLMKYADKVKGIKLEQPSLNNFTIQQLKNVVDTFKKNLSTIRAEKQKFSEQQRRKQTRSSILLQEQPKKQKTYYKNMAWDYRLVLPILQCNRQKHFFDSRNSSISIKFINHFFKKSKGFFGIGGEMVLWIEIQTSYIGKKIKVARTIDDFLFLNKTLQRIFPYSYIPPLRISKDDMKQQTQKQIKKMISRCFGFISNISQREDLLQNVYTFRFLVEEKPNNYQQHKLNNNNICVQGLNNFKNIEGKISVDVSQEAEMIKKDYMTKSGHFEKIWRSIGNVMTLISKSSKQLSQQLIFLKQQLQSTKCDQFPSYKDLITDFQTIVNVQIQRINESDAALSQLKYKFVDKTCSNWQSFIQYQVKISAASFEYQQKRKQYLQGEAIKLMQPFVQKAKINKADLKIQFLNLQNNPSEEEWFLTETPWYGYLNHEYITTFKNFVRKDKQRLHKQLKKIPQIMNHRIFDNQSPNHPISQRAEQ